MATEDKKLNLNEITWATRDTGFVPGDGEMWWYDNSGTKIFVIGDGSTTLANLPYYSPKAYTDVMDFFTGGTYIFPGLTGYKTTNDIMRCVAMWPGVPTPGTVVTFTLPSGSLNFESDSASATITGAHTISGVSIGTSWVFFQINETGAFTSVPVNAALHPRISGNGCKLTIT